MTQQAQRAGRAGRILVWILTILPALGIGLSGISKFSGSHWRDLFIGWGYPAWFTYVVGVAEVAGVIGLFIPRVARYAAVLLTAVMVGAFVTLFTHRGGPLGWGATPLVYIVMLTVVGIARWRDARLHQRAT